MMPELTYVGGLVWPQVAQAWIALELHTSSRPDRSPVTVVPPL